MPSFIRKSPVLSEPQLHESVLLIGTDRMRQVSAHYIAVVPLGGGLVMCLFEASILELAASISCKHQPRAVEKTQQ